MAYTRKNWQTGEAITEQSMNRMEDGIEAALGYDSRISAAQSTATSAANKANTNEQNITLINTSIANLTTSIEQNAANGNNAMSQIAQATTANTPQYDNLDARFTKIETDALTE